MQNTLSRRKDNETEVMKEFDWICALEKRNQEFSKKWEAASPEAELGHKLLTFRRAFPFHILQWYKKRRAFRAAQKKSASISHPLPPEKRFYYTAPPVQDKKGVVYSCITSGYDLPFEPLFRDPALDYVLFTDDQNPIENSVWIKQPIKEGFRAREKENQINRYYKFHSFDCFPGYDYAIYIDGNVRIMSDITALYRCAQASPIGIAMHRHAHRSCIYQEAKWCEYNGRGNLPAIQQQMLRYEEEGMPRDYGMAEATIIVTDLHNSTARSLLENWWTEFCDAGSGRDQLCFPYILWKNQYSMDSVGCLGNDEYHNPKFSINAHRGVLF